MRRALRIIKFGLLGLFGLLGIALIGLAIANAPMNAQINEHIAKLQAAGEPVKIADLDKNRPKPEENAATYLDLAEKDCLAIQDAVGDFKEQQSKEREKQGEEIDTLPEDDPKLIEAYRVALAAHPKAIPLLIQASNCERYHLKLNYQNESPIAFLEEMMEKVQNERAAIRTLNYHARLLLAEGKPEEALDTTLVMLRLCNLFGHAPTMMGQLVAVACRSFTFEVIDQILRSGELSADARKRLDAELARQDIRGAFRESFRTERPIGLAHYESVLPAGYTTTPMGKRDQLSYLELLDVLTATADRPFGDPEAKTKVQAVLDRAGAMTTLLMPAVEAASAAVTRNEAQLRCLRVLNALAAHSDSGQDVQLGDLGLPAEATLDPFNGKPLTLKHTPRGWLVYSVGQNLQDEGGQLDDEASDVGYGPVSSTP